MFNFGWFSSCFFIPVGNTFVAFTDDGIEPFVDFARRFEQPVFQFAKK